MRLLVLGLIAVYATLSSATPFRKDFEADRQDSDVDTSAPEGTDVVIVPEHIQRGVKDSLHRFEVQADPLPDGSDPGRLCWPRWPHDFAWNSAGPIPGKLCYHIREPSDPHTWNDNYFCSVVGPGWINPQFQWSFAGPVTGMRCTQILEAADPHTWSDNYLCVPHCSPYKFRWSSAGPINGLQCIQWLEAADPNTWSDNYLCM